MTKTDIAENSSEAQNQAMSSRVGLGVDIVEISRVRKILERTPRFKARYFTESEINYCDKRADPAKSYAARFAAKEAAVKALGTGFSNGISPKDIEVITNDEGRPFLKLSNAAHEVYVAKRLKEMALSLSHTELDAVACVVAISENAELEAVAKVDPAAELASQFKKVKAMLDDI